jgi:hypothetical protein
MSPARVLASHREQAAAGAGAACRLRQLQQVTGAASGNARGGNGKRLHRAEVTINLSQNPLACQAICTPS